MSRRFRAAFASSLAGMACLLLTKGWGGSGREAMAAADLARARDALRPAGREG